MSCLYDLVRIPIYRRCGGYYIRWYYNGWHYWYFRPGKINFNTEGEKYRTLGTQTFTIGTGQISETQANAIRTIMNTREVYIYTDSGWGAVRVMHSPQVVYDHATHGYEMEFTIVIGSKTVSVTGYSPTPVLPSREPDPQCEIDIAIAEQTWMCKNWDAAYPGSLVYDMDVDNVPEFGGLYTWAQVMTPGFCPDGWHVPTLAEWQALIAACGGTALAGGVLKEIGFTHWGAPNTGAVDTHGFAAVGGGRCASYRMPLVFEHIFEYGYFWTADALSAAYAYAVRLNSSDADADIISHRSVWALSLRLIKNIYTPVPMFLLDYDGNSYTTIIINKQEWTIENLRVEHYADGTVIPKLTIDADWAAEDGSGGHDGACCYYDNDENYKNIYGALYNWYAVDNAHGLAYFTRNGIQEGGWRLPTLADVNALSAFLGGDAVSGGKLKEAGLTHWDAPNPADNSSGFTGLPGGERNAGGPFAIIGETGEWWTATEHDAGSAEQLDLDSGNTISVIGSIEKGIGQSIRCVRDIIVYGLLYNWYAATDVREIAAAGWSVPTKANFQTLMQYYDPLGTYNNNTAGGPLKEKGSTYWDIPNTGANNESNFNGRGAGQRAEGTGICDALNFFGLFWTSEGAAPSGDMSYLVFNTMVFNSYSGADRWTAPVERGLSIRLIKNITTLTHGQGGSYVGNDGKIYRTICIGTQEWVADNLVETKYRNGDDIPEVTDNAAWAALATGALCAYDNDWDNV